MKKQRRKKKPRAKEERVANDEEGEEKTKKKPSEPRKIKLFCVYDNRGLTNHVEIPTTINGEALDPPTIRSRIHSHCFG